MANDAVDFRLLSRRRFIGLGLLPSMAVLSGCSSMEAVSNMFKSEPKPSEFSLGLSASPSINPDIEGRPSPIWVRIYQLRSVGVFKTAEFEPLFANDAAVLGAEMLERSEFVITPSQVIEPTAPTRVHEDTRFIGAIAAYHEINLAKWRDVIDMPAKDQKVNLTVALDRVALRLRSEPI